MGIGMSSVKDIFGGLERVREVYRTTDNVHEALKYALTPHEGLRVIAEEKLNVILREEWVKESRPNSRTSRRISSLRKIHEKKLVSKG